MRLGADVDGLETNTQRWVKKPRSLEREDRIILNTVTCPVRNSNSVY